MLACMGKGIVMGRHSNLGPIDPQIYGLPAIAVLKEFEQAYSEIQVDNTKLAVWRPILEKYQPTYLSQCNHAIRWSRQIGIDAVQHGMFNGEKDAHEKANDIVEQLISHEVHLAHGRHLHREDCKRIGLKIMDLEEDQGFQDVVLTLHHSIMITLANTQAAKIIENHLGIGSIRLVGP